MSYDEPPPARRRVRGPVIVTIAALAPTALAGWLVWQAMSGPGGDGPPPRVLPLPSQSGRSGEAGPSSPAPGGSSPAGADRKSPGSPGPDRSGSAAPSSPAKDTGGTGDTEDAGPGGGPLSGKVVVIDPGHNIDNRAHTAEINRQVDVGTHRKECDTTGTSTDAGYAEAAFTLDLAHRLRDRLRAEGATVKLTHDGDRPYGPCVDERARIGNLAGADAVVSIHADGSGAGNRGFHVILPASVRAGKADTRAITGPSRELGERIVGKFVQFTGSAPANYVGGGTGLDVRRDLGGLNLSTVPKVFIECGNMRDPRDAALLTSGKWRGRAAQGLAEGIKSYLGG